MDIITDWEEIRKIFNTAGKTSKYFSIATTASDGTPHISPIGSLFLDKPCRGIFVDEYPMIMARNLDKNPRVCVMAVNTGFGFWLKSLFKGKFSSMPAIRLTGIAGKRRAGTKEEIGQWLHRVKHFRKFKGYELLWKHMKHVREINFDSAIPISVGQMSRRRPERGS